jgi:predicted deacylase
MKVGTAKAVRGKISRGEITLGEYPDGLPVNSAVAIAQGLRSGPTAWLQACVHGPEVGGSIGIRAFLKDLRLDQLRGTIICLLTANPLAFRSFRRLTPIDGMNLNRAFPGKTGGSTSEQIALRVFEMAFKAADVMIDLHSGGDHLICCYHVIFSDERSKAGAESRRLAFCTNARNLWNAAGLLDGAAFSEFVRRGKPALLIESGGGASVTRQDIKNYAMGIRGVCQGMSMLPGQPPTEKVRLGQNVAFLRSSTGGFFEPVVKPGGTVRKNQKLGAITNLHGDVREIFHCPFEKGWVAAIRRPFMPAHSGEDVIEIVELTPPAKSSDRKRSHYEVVSA